jgi:hypothetical protein
MAEQSLTTEVRRSLAEDMRATYVAVYAIQAMAEGAAALLEKSNYPDTTGEVWAARLLAEQISAEVARVLDRESELELFDRAEQLEGVAA